MIDKLKRMLSDHDALIEKLQKKIAALKEQKKLSSKRHDFDSREADKDDFDGSSTPDLPPEDTKTDIPSSVEKKEGLPYRKGMFYNRITNVSAACHTLISTCWANGISSRAYLKKFFRELVKDRRNYENLLPMTTEININKL